MKVGIVGGGQLARMLALAGHPLGLDFVVLDPDPDACAGAVTDLLVGDYDDPARLAELARRTDVVTFDFENVPARALADLARQVPVFPPPAALELAQDRLHEKTLFRELGIPTPPFAAVDSLEDLRRGVEQMGLPAVLKTRRLGYDGKGQRVLRDPADLAPAWQALGSAPLLLEGFVAFQREVSILAVRGRDGADLCYPLAENRHLGGVLRRSRAPYHDPGLEALARDYAGRLLRRLDYVGVLAVEFFAVDDGLMANEIAPRVHNSGHWTIEGAETSQFENHLRAVLGLPLGDVGARGHTALVNFIGEVPDRGAFLAVPGAHYHAYGKASRVGRKVGHGTLRADDPARLEQALTRVLPLVGLSDPPTPTADPVDPHPGTSAPGDRS